MKCVQSLDVGTAALRSCFEREGGGGRDGEKERFHFLSRRPIR